MTRSMLKVALALALLLLIVGTGQAAEILPDMVPSSGPLKITSTGRYKLDANEQFVSIEIMAAPAGGVGGRGGYREVHADQDQKTYCGAVENLAPNTEYDVRVVLKYSINGSDHLYFSRCYRVRTKEIGKNAVPRKYR